VARCSGTGFQAIGHKWVGFVLTQCTLPIVRKASGHSLTASGQTPNLGSVKSYSGAGMAVIGSVR